MALSSLDDAVGGRELGDSEGGDDPSGSSSSSSGGGDEGAAEEASVVGAPWERFDDWIEWGEGNGSEWDWHHATQYRETRGDLHWSRRWRQAQGRRAWTPRQSGCVAFCRVSLGCPSDESLPMRSLCATIRLAL